MKEKFGKDTKKSQNIMTMIVESSRYSFEKQKKHASSQLTFFHFDNRRSIISLK